jgi:hypothetical protein
LRCCIFHDTETASDSKQFIFHKKFATCKEILDGFIATYADYTYTQDENTGVIWFHRKAVNYPDILRFKVKIDRPAIQVPMCTGVLSPLQSIVGGAPYPIHDKNWVATFNYYVDLPSGSFCARDVINMCCAANINTGFCVIRDKQGAFEISPWNLIYLNPLAPPRTAAVNFWNTEFSEREAIPSIDKIAAALSDPLPRKRWAAGVYLRGTTANYRTRDLLVNVGSDSEKILLIALQLKRIEVPGQNFPYLTKFLEQHQGLQRVLTNQLTDLAPGVALLAALELAREKNDITIMDIVANHRFSRAEIAMIKPDLIRIAREYPQVRERLSKLKFDDPELTPSGINDLYNTNIFSHVETYRK